MEKMNEDVDPGMKGREYRDCAKGAHMTPTRDTGDKVTVRLILDVDVSRSGVGDYYEEYPDMKALNADYKALLIGEAYSTWQFDGLVTDVRYDGTGLYHALGALAVDIPSGDHTAIPMVSLADIKKVLGA